MDRGSRDEMLGRLAEVIGSRTAAHPVRVAVDGPPAAGKTTLADELAVVLRARGRPVIRATIDDFLFPRARRYSRGEYSAEGCYFDTHDYDSLNRVLLDPLGPGGDRRFRDSVYDRSADAVLSRPFGTAPAGAVLLFDGVFLMRPELLDRWELRVFVSIPLERDRGSRRDPGAPGGLTGPGRTALARALPPRSAALLRPGRPGRSGRFRRAQRGTRPARLGDPGTLTVTRRWTRRPAGSRAGGRSGPSRRAACGPSSGRARSA